MARRRALVRGAAVGALVDDSHAWVEADGAISTMRIGKLEKEALMLEHALSLVPPVHAQRVDARDKCVVGDVRVLEP